MDIGWNFCERVGPLRASFRLGGNDGSGGYDACQAVRSMLLACVRTPGRAYATLVSGGSNPPRPLTMGLHQWARDFRCARLISLPFMRPNHVPYYLPQSPPSLLTTSDVLNMLRMQVHVNYECIG